MLQDFPSSLIDKFPQYEALVVIDKNPLTIEPGKYKSFSIAILKISGFISVVRRSQEVQVLDDVASALNPARGPFLGSHDSFTFYNCKKQKEGQ